MADNKGVGAGRCNSNSQPARVVALGGGWACTFAAGTGADDSGLEAVEGIKYYARHSLGVKSVESLDSMRCGVLEKPRIEENGTRVVDSASVGLMRADQLSEEAFAEGEVPGIASGTTPSELVELQAFDPATLGLDSTKAQLEEAFLQVLASPAIASKRWTFVKGASGSIAIPGMADAAIVHVGGRGRGEDAYLGLAVALSRNTHYARIDPRNAVKVAVAQACRHLACVGATPLAVTGCCDIEPDTSENAYLHQEYSTGLAEACAGAGVSFRGLYPSDDEANQATPLVVAVGKLPDYRRAVGQDFVREGDVIVMLGDTFEELGGSEYLATSLGKEAGAIPNVDFEFEMAVENVVRAGIDRGFVTSAHDCSEGGLACALAECGIVGDMGCDVQIDDDMTPASSLFSETQSRIIVTLNPKDAEAFADMLDDADIAYTALGSTGGDRITIIDDRERRLIDLPLREIAEAYKKGKDLLSQ